MKFKRKKIFGILLCFMLVLGLIPKMSLTAYANDAYSGIKNTTTVVNFDGKDWYLIDYDDDTVTLLAKECVAASEYDSSGHYVEYNSSTIKTVVDAYYTNSISNEAKAAVNGDGMFLIFGRILWEISHEVLQCPQYPGTDMDAWWTSDQGMNGNTRTPFDSATYVFGNNGFIQPQGDTTQKLGVRPALKLNLSSVKFSSDTNTFSVKSSYVVTYKIVNGTWSDGTTAEKTETVTEGENPVNVPTGMIASSGYKGGSWDTDPTNVTITSDATYTYTFTADSSSGSSTTDTSTKVSYENIAITAGSITDITGTVAATAESNPFSTKIENSSSLTSLLSLTDAEVAQGVNVWLDIQDISSTVSATDKNLISNASGDYKVGLYIDVNLFKKVGNNDAVKITETNGKIKFSIVIPESIRKSGRTFELIRLHDGKATALTGNYDETTGKFTVETDQFSTYAIAYKDAASSNSTSTDNSSSDSTNSTTSTAPKTGDTNDIRVWFLLLLASLGGLGVLGFTKKRNAE